MRLRYLPLLVATTLLWGCGDSIDDLNQPTEAVPEEHSEHEHNYEHIAGRLLISAAEQAEVSVFNAEDLSLVELLPTTHVVSGMYATPSLRYAALIQRDQGLVEFIDGGVYSEDHGDHMHPYEQAPSLSSLQLSGAKPTHFDAAEQQAALFFDGDKQNTVNASVTLLDDHHIGEGEVIAHHEFATYMHGAAQIRGDYVLATYREASSDTVLPSQVELFHRHDDHLHHELRFAPTCPMLHGSAQNEEHIAFGCSDGVLLIEQQDTSFSAHKIANPEGLEGRIGTIKASHNSHDLLAITSAKRLFNLDPENHDMTEVLWRDEADVDALASTFSAHHGAYFILDNHGDLHVFEGDGGWHHSTHFNLFSEVSENYQLAVAADEEALYVLNQQENMLHKVDLESQAITATQELNFAASKLQWLGIAEDEHDHAH